MDIGTGARQKIAGGTAVIMTVVMAAILANGGPGIDFNCDQEFTDYFELSASVNDTDSSGQTLCVKAGMGDQDPLFINQAQAENVRIIAFPPNGTINAPTLVFAEGASNYTVEGFEFTGENQVGLDSGTSNIRIVKNNCHDQKLDCIQASNGGDPQTNIEVLGNKFRRIEFDGEFPHGYGMYGGVYVDLKINYNECDGGSDGTVNLMGDCWELTGVDGYEMVGNWIHDVRCFACGDTHSDGFSFSLTSHDGLIQDNVIDGFAQNTLSPEGYNTTIHNNLIVDGQGNCFDGGISGTSVNTQPTNWTITNNTIYGCGFFGYRTAGPVGTGGNNVITDNIIEDGDCTPDGYLIATGNVDAHHPTLDNGSQCAYSGVTNYNDEWTPNWDGTNTGNRPTYQASNLPTGYEGAGYRPAPYGPPACPC